MSTSEEKTIGGAKVSITKPADTDTYDISIFNQNFSNLLTGLNNLQTEVTALAAKVRKGNTKPTGGGTGDADDAGGPVLPLLPLLQKQHHEQRRQGEIQTRGVEGQEAAQQAAQGRGGYPVAVIQQGYPEVEVLPRHALRRLQGGDQGKGLVAEDVDQERANLAQALVFIQHTDAVKNVPGVHHNGQQEGLQGVKGRDQQRDSHILHTAAKADGAHQRGPQRPVTVGGHQ